ncbi:MAG: DNA primase [Salinisphaeraceae bacterium]
MARIPQGFIDDLLARTDIVSVVESRVPLKKAGREYQACCPFHDEKTPSFTVSPAKQFYHCFGCGAHGTALSFLMEYERLEFREAVEALAGQAGMTIPEEARGAGPDADTQKPLFAVLEQAGRLYQNQLRQSPAAIDYLKSRGITGATAKAFGIGYAPDSWEFLRGQVRDRQAAVTAGLLIEKDNGQAYDRFRNRIMFPIRDGRGRVIGFGGRALGDDPAKYLNSPETPLFHKGRSLYGLFEARQALREIPRMLLVEGYMDVVALAQHGFANAVATLGTATTAEHLNALFRATDEVVFCFDGDRAGRDAAWRALDNALPVMRGTRRARFLFLPEGEDPDSLVRQTDGTAELTRLIDASRSASQVLLDGLTEGLDMKDADGRSRLVEKARPFVTKLPPEAFKADLIREIARRSGLPAEDLDRLYREGGTAGGRRAPAEQRQRPVKFTPVRRALQLLMNDPRLADKLPIDIAALTQSGVAGADLLADGIEFFRANPHLPAAAWLEHWRDHQAGDALQRLAAETPRGEPEDLAREFRECVARALEGEKQHERERFQALMTKQQATSLTPDEAAEAQALLERLRRGPQA